jgi:hypothetical protein
MQNRSSLRIKFYTLIMVIVGTTKLKGLQICEPQKFLSFNNKIELEMHLELENTTMKCQIVSCNP